MKTASWIARGLVVVGAVALAACSSSSNNNTGTAGTTGAAGKGGTTGTAGTGGSTAGTGGSTATAGTGGSATTGGTGGAAAGTGGATAGTGGATAGTGGAAAGTGGSAGAGGTAGAGGSGGTGGVPCVGDPPVTEHNMCSTIPSGKKGDAAFTISSPDFTSCGVIPAATHTCDGKAFGTGTSPALTWTGAPTGTMSFALVFKDIAILADNNPMTERLGYHWVMWDIPATRTSLPAGLTGGYHSAEVPGALQWSGRNNYGYFPPCPNPFPRSDSRFTCSLVIDSYSFTLYALPTAKLTGLPMPDLDATTGLPTGNYVVKLAKYIDSLSALAVTEYRGTSQAWASSFAPPSPVQYPCMSYDGGVPTADGGTAPSDAGTPPDGGMAVCLQ